MPIVKGPSVLAHRHVKYEGFACNEDRNGAKIYSMVGALHFRIRVAPEFSQKQAAPGKSLYTSEVMARIATLHDSVPTVVLIITHCKCRPS